jgi:hypothetical protein
MKLDTPSFKVGLIVGSILVGFVWAGTVWWTAQHARSPEDEAAYEMCLADHQGNTIACDAFMRMVGRSRDFGKYLKERGAQYRAAGFSKREVVEWATKQGGVGSQISDAAGISLEELQSGKC